MGGGSYSPTEREARLSKMSADLGYSYYTAPASKIFAKKANDKMSPVGIEYRESRDSEEHPKSYPIILGLDVTGSMGSIPAYLIKSGLPNIMSKIIEGGIKDPQLLFIGLGDSHYDSAPLQVGQFESSDELLDYWLENMYLEGGGGGNSGEDYLLAHHFALNHTVTDSYEKRGIRGILITIGDERYLELLDKNISDVYNTKTQSQKAKNLIADVSKKYIVYHIHTNNRQYQDNVDVVAEWKELIGEQNVIVENNREKLAEAIVKIILASYYSEQNNTNDIEKPFSVSDSVIVNIKPTVTDVPVTKKEDGIIDNIINY